MRERLVEGEIIPSPNTEDTISHNNNVGFEEYLRDTSVALVTQNVAEGEKPCYL